MASLKSSQRKFIRSLTTGSSKRRESSDGQMRKNKESGTLSSQSERTQKPDEHCTPTRPGMSKSPDLEGSRNERRGEYGYRDVLSSTMHPRIAPTLRGSPSNDALFRTMAPTVTRVFSTGMQKPLTPMYVFTNIAHSDYRSHVTY